MPPESLTVTVMVEVVVPLLVQVVVMTVKLVSRSLGIVALVEELGIPVVSPSNVEAIAKKNNRAGLPSDDDKEEAKQQTYALQFHR